MAQKSDFLDVDLLNMKPVPGEGLTQEPGLRPYERPPKIVNVDEALQYIYNSSINNPQVRGDIMEALDMGMSVETVVSALVLNAFTEGVFSPDIAEMIKPPLIQLFTQAAADEGIEDLNIVNSNIPKEMNTVQKYDVMRNLNPKKFNRLMDDANSDDLQPAPDNMEEEKAEKDMVPQGFVNRQEMM